MTRGTRGLRGAPFKDEQLKCALNVIGGPKEAQRILCWPASLTAEEALVSGRRLGLRGPLAVPRLRPRVVVASEAPRVLRPWASGGVRE